MTGTVGEDDVVAIVLGAGASRRLGRPKQTLPFGDTTLLGHVLADVEASGADRVVLVLGGAAEEVRAHLTPRRATVVDNRRYGTGCASSLLAGLDAAEPCAAIALVLGDMPGVTPPILDAVIDQWLRRRPWAAVTRYRDGIGHPLLFSAAAFGELRTRHGDKAAWKIVDREPEDRVIRLAVDADRPLDVDTWDDYLTVCARFAVAPHA